MASPTTPKNKQAFKTPGSQKKASSTPTISAGDSSGRLFTMAVVALVVVGMGVVAFLASQRDSDIPNGPQVAEVEVDGTPLAQFPRDAQLAVTDASSDAAVGQVAPTLRGTDFDGESVTIGADGRAKAVYFLAHWCPNCQAEVPVVQGLVDSGQVPDGVDLYAVSTSVRDQPNANYPPELWFNREGWTSPVMRDSETSTALGAWGGVSFPYVVYLDGDNRVISRSAGQLDEVVTLSLWQALAEGTSTGSVEGDDEGTTQLDEEGNPIDPPAGGTEEPTGD